VADRSVSVPMTLSDPEPGFQGHSILTSPISQKWCVLGTKLLHTKKTNRKPYLTYQMALYLVTLTDLLTRRVVLSASADLLVFIVIKKTSSADAHKPARRI